MIVSLAENVETCPDQAKTTQGCSERIQKRIHCKRYRASKFLRPSQTTLKTRTLAHLFCGSQRRLAEVYRFLYSVELIAPIFIRTHEDHFLRQHRPRGAKLMAFCSWELARDGVEPPTPAFSGATETVLAVTYKDVEGCETLVRTRKD